MKTYKVLEIKQSVFEDNDQQAELLREQLKGLKFAIDAIALGKEGAISIDFCQYTIYF